YRDNGWQDGSGGFANGGVAKQISSGWGTYAKVFSGGNGVIYAIDPAGKLFWYRDNGWQDGSGGFANGGVAKQIRTNW
ncbi:MAG TPA: tachylectin-related carbohydrate-binding protein, partial [Actinomycetota bacterium]